MAELFRLVNYNNLPRSCREHILSFCSHHLEKQINRYGIILVFSLINEHKSLLAVSNMFYFPFHILNGK